MFTTPSFWLHLQTLALFSSMASTLSSLSSIVNQPHCGLRLKLHSLGFRFLSPKAEAFISRCYHHRTSRTLQSCFALNLSRSFSQSHFPLADKTDTSGLHQFIAKASFTASETLPQWVLADTPFYKLLFVNNLSS